MEHEQWKTLLTHGNSCFHDKQWRQAEFFYSEAYDLLAFAYRNNPMNAEILMAWICACHNLSSLYETTNKLDLALKFLIVPHEYLQEITEAMIDDDDIKLIAYKGLSITLSPILLFAQKHPVCDSCIEQLTALNIQLSQEIQVLH